MTADQEVEGTSMHHRVKRWVSRTHRGESGIELYRMSWTHANVTMRQRAVPAFTRGQRIIRFLGTGVVSTFADLGILYLLTSYMRIWYLESATFSYCCGILLSYIMNKYLTFHDYNRHYFTQFSLFVMISLCCLCVNLGVLWTLVEFFSMHFMAAKILAIFCGFLWNYYGQSRITFRGSIPLQKAG